MPQLDRIIIFTQLFWLFVVFVATYTILVTLFLPILIKLFKTRYLLVQFTLEEINKLQRRFYLNQQIIIQTLNGSLYILKHFLDLKPVSFQEKISNIALLDVCLLIYILDLVLYCNKSVFDLICYNSKNYNFIFNSK